MLEVIRSLEPVFTLGALLALAALRWAQGPYSAWLAFLPGTIAHELAHYLIALITRSRPKPLSLRLQRTTGGWQLGAVEFAPGVLSGGLVALAPLYLLPPFCVLVAMSSREASWQYQLAAGYTAVTFLHAAIPSKADWQIAFRYPLGTLLVLGPPAFVLANAILSGG